MEDVDKGVNVLSIPGWLMRGAIREDDVCPFSPCDAPDNLIRVLNHFFDPVNDRPLTVAGVALGARATDWATGLRDTYQNPVPDTARANHFSLLDAREAMYRALTGRDSEGNTDIGPGRTPATKAVRKAYWATTFRALGDVLHLVQDMAQPQHTRNDAHLVNGRVGKTLYEAFTDARAKGGQFTCFSGVKKPLPPLVYGSHAPVKLGQYRQFFSSNPGPAGDVLTGTGIADYSNRSFFTAGTNIGTTTYTYPATDATVYATISTVTPDPCANPGKFAPRELLVVDSIVDRLDPAYNDTDHNATPYSNNNPVPLSTRGVWRVRKPGPNKNNFYVDKEGYGLSDDNYLAMGNHLIPRAVGYSAGLIDYFFRGRLFIEDAAESAANFTFTVRNVSDNFAFTDGKFELFYYTTQDTLVPLAIKGPNPGDDQVNTVTGILNAGDTRTLVADVPDYGTDNNPDNDLDITRERPMVLVYTGLIGQEQGVAAVVFERSLGRLIAKVDKVFYLPNPSIAWTDTDPSVGIYRSSALPFTQAWKKYDYTGFSEEFYKSDLEIGNYYRPVSMAYVGNSTLVMNGYHVDFTLGDSGAPNENVTWISTDLGASWTLTVNNLAPGIDAAAGTAFPYLSLPLTYIGGTSLLSFLWDGFYTTVPRGTSVPIRSDDLGKTWTVAGPPIDILEHVGNATYTGNDTLLIAGTQDDSGQGKVYVIYRSLDGGRTWSRIYFGWPAFQSAHRFSHHLVYTGNNTLVTTFAQGTFQDPVPVVAESTDGGVTWTQVGSFPAGTSSGSIRLYLGNDRYIAVAGTGKVNTATPSVTTTYLVSNRFTQWDPIASPGSAEFVYAADNGGVPGLYDTSTP